jgi:hypothetical protein
VDAIISHIPYIGRAHRKENKRALAPLPNNVVQNFFSFLPDVIDACRFSRVCCQFYKVSLSRRDELKIYSENFSLIVNRILKFIENTRVDHPIIKSYTECVTWKYFVDFDYEYKCHKLTNITCNVLALCLIFDNKIIYKDLRGISSFVDYYNYDDCYIRSEGFVITQKVIIYDILIGNVYSRKGLKLIFNQTLKPELQYIAQKVIKHAQKLPD